MWFIPVFESTAYLKFTKLQYVSSGFRCRCNSLSWPPGQLDPQGSRYPGVSWPPSWVSWPPGGKISLIWYLACRYPNQGILTPLRKFKVLNQRNIFNIMSGGGEDNQGGGEDTLGNFNPRGSSCPQVSWPPGVKLPRGQDKPGHYRVTDEALLAETT